MKRVNYEDTICALATGGGMSAIALIRISGKKSISTINNIFSKNLTDKESHTAHFGNIIDKKDIIDEVIVTIFRKNNSFTGEETVEISCHGSKFIQNKIIELLIDSGVRLADPGEFSMRAFKNGKVDLSQAESIADLIESESEAAHKTAIQQLKGGFSKKLTYLREKLIDFASLIELELDFSEEDVEFANRKQLEDLVNEMHKETSLLINSFRLGNSIKNGIPVAILGAPNVGKSTLLNSLLNEDRAIVSEIAGTTRDAIEDQIVINGFNYRFVDTAGIRKTDDKIENLGIERSLSHAKKSNIIIYLIDATQDIKSQLKNIRKLNNDDQEKVIKVINKIDLNEKVSSEINDAIYISAINQTGIDILKNRLCKFTNVNSLDTNNTVVTNQRHYEQLLKTITELELVIKGLEDGLSSDLLAINIKESLYHLGLITGEVSSDDLLGNIFGKFCIGK
ncbi:tRNA uridine-5-carboxymethylaminomethyl(34) synthesis GTPase MnmE [Flavobacteriales bacterium]|nr:tRNA uridine-5-carboxymethylaminomethyl(34) synthesis GTPase MnmE [Flavobacteriales bacterium]